MVSFSCEVCNDVVKKPKLDSHKGQCRGAYFTCIDCNTTFDGGEYKGHTSCISEAQKYQGALYKPEKGKGKNGKQAAAPATEPVLEKTKEPADVTPAPVEPAAEEKRLTKEEKKGKVRKASKERKDRRKAEKEGKSVETEKEEVAAVVEEVKEMAIKEIETVPKKELEDKKEKKGKKDKMGKEEKEEKKRKAEESKEMFSLAKKGKKDKKDKRKIEEVSSESSTIESGEKEASLAKRPKRERAPKAAPEDQAIGTAFLALFQKGHPLTFSKALARLEKEHGVDVQKKLFAVLRLKKVKEDIVLSVV